MSLSLITRKFTVEEYEKMSAQGILKAEEKVELICGEIIKMSPMGTRHASCIARLTKLFYQKFANWGDPVGSGFAAQVLIWVQNPITLNNHSQPEPDLSLLIPREDFYALAHPCPEDIYLIIEVSDSTLDYDRNIKIPLYAEAKIKEVWIVNINESCVEVYRHPLDGGYQTIQKYYQGERVFIASFPDIEFTITGILGV